MLTEKFINTNKGRLYWVYVVVRQGRDVGRHFETIRVFFDENEASDWCHEMNIYSKYWEYSVNKTKIVI